MSGIVNVCEENRWTYRRFCELYCGINICSGIKSLSIHFFVFLLIQITGLGIILIYTLYYTDSGVLSEIAWNWNTDESSAGTNISDSVRYSSLRINESLGKFNYIPEQRKTLYLWKRDSVIPVKPSTLLFYGKERALVNEDICTKLESRTKYNITLTADPERIDCKAMRREMDEINGYVFKEELDMPIAYSILVYTDYEMIELLLRTVYKRHNTYCIHIDAKSPEHFRNRVMKLANCFDNVMIATKLVSVYWGQFSILEAEMSCMKDLFNKTKSWKYFINLTGQEFPLRTNYEIAKILRALRGHNNIGCSKNFEHYRLRTSGPPPHGLEVYKASTHVILTRKFVEYLLTDEIAHRVLMWSRKLLIPDEMVFPILNCNRKLKAPGSYKEHPSLYDYNKSFVSRYKLWRHRDTQCHGKIVRDICIFGSRDVENLLTRHELFANKFHFSEFPEVPFCLRNILLKRTILEYKGYMDFNVSFYSNIPYKW